MSSETDELADSLRDQAIAAMANERHQGQEALEIAFEKMVHKAKAHAAEKEEQRDKLVQTEKELEITKEALQIHQTRLQKLELLMSMGDWAGDILKWLRATEISQVTDERTSYVAPKLKARGGNEIGLCNLHVVLPGNLDISKYDQSQCRDVLSRWLWIRAQT